MFNKKEMKEKALIASVDGIEAEIIKQLGKENMEPFELPAMKGQPRKLRNAFSKKWGLDMSLFGTKAQFDPKKLYEVVQRHSQVISLSEEEMTEVAKGDDIMKRVYLKGLKMAHDDALKIVEANPELTAFVKKAHKLLDETEKAITATAEAGKFECTIALAKTTPARNGVFKTFLKKTGMSFKPGEKEQEMVVSWN